MICNCPVIIDIHTSVFPSAESCNSRSIFQFTQSGRMPPARTGPTTCNNWAAAAANVIRRTVAAMIPTRTAFVRCCSGNTAAAKLMTMALSPGQDQLDQDDLKECCYLV
jgi:hypothetical protein